MTSQKLANVAANLAAKLERGEMPDRHYCAHLVEILRATADMVATFEQAACITVEAKQ